MTENKTSRVNYQQVVTAFVLNGMSAVESLNNVSRPTLERAAQYLQENGRQDSANALLALADEKFPLGPNAGGQGRLALSVVGDREYSVQQANGQLFIRLPMEALNCNKGDKVRAFVEDGAIVVRSV